MTNKNSLDLTELEETTVNETVVVDETSKVDETEVPAVSIRADADETPTMTEPAAKMVLSEIDNALAQRIDRIAELTSSVATFAALAGQPEGELLHAALVREGLADSDPEVVVNPLASILADLEIDRGEYDAAVKVVQLSNPRGMFDAALEAVQSSLEHKALTLAIAAIVKLWDQKLDGVGFDLTAVGKNAELTTAIQSIDPIGFTAKLKSGKSTSNSGSGRAKKGSYVVPGVTLCAKQLANSYIVLRAYPARWRIELYANTASTADPEVAVYRSEWVNPATDPKLTLNKVVNSAVRKGTTATAQLSQPVVWGKNAVPYLTSQFDGETLSTLLESITRASNSDGSEWSVDNLLATNSETYNRDAATQLTLNATAAEVDETAEVSETPEG